MLIAIFLFVYLLSHFIISTHPTETKKFDGFAPLKGILDSLLAAIPLLIMVMSIYIETTKSGAMRSTSFSPWLYIVGSVLEEPASVPGDIEKKYFFRIVLGTWSLLAVNFTSSYSSLMVTDLNAPYPPIRINHFQDLVCDHHLYNQRMQKFKQYDSNQITVHEWLEYFLGIFIPLNDIWTTAETQRFQNNRGEMANVSSNCFKLLSRRLEYYGRLYEFYEFLLNQISLTRDTLSHGSIYTGFNLLESPHYLLLFQLMDTRHAFGPNITDSPGNETIEANKAIDLEVGQCGKAVFIAYSNSLLVELEYFRVMFPQKQFYSGKIFHGELGGWRFADIGYSKVMTYFLNIVESGIYKRLWEEGLDRVIKSIGSIVNKTSKIKENDAMPMTDGVTTLFYVCVIVIAFAILVLTVESRSIVFTHTIVMIKTVRMFLAFKLFKIYDYCFNISSSERAMY